VKSVGVIVPCFNQGHFAAECVASLRAQTYANWRAVVLDDASTDDSWTTLQTLASDRVSVVHLDRNLGRALVRNEAVRRLGDVDYVLNIDCDDVLTPTYIEKLAAALDANPRAGLAYGLLHFFGAMEGNTWPSKPLVREARFLENVIPGPSVLFRAEALRQTKGWRREFTKSSGEDWDIWLQVVGAGWDVVWVRDAEYRYRQHSQSFLAQSSERTQIEVQLNLLGLHAKEIAGTVGLDAFLTPQVLPALLGAFRRGDVRYASHLLRRLLRSAPLATLSLVARHYGRRLRAILKR